MTALEYLATLNKDSFLDELRLNKQDIDLIAQRVVAMLDAREKTKQRLFVPDIAKELGVTENYVYQLDLGPWQWHGKRKFMFEDDLKQWQAERNETPKEKQPPLTSEGISAFIRGEMS